MQLQTVISSVTYHCTTISSVKGRTGGSAQGPLKDKLYLRHKG